MAFVVHPPFVHLLLFTPACADIRDNGITAVLQVVTRNLELIGTKSFVSPPSLINLPRNTRAVVDVVSLPPSIPLLTRTEKLSSEDNEGAKRCGTILRYFDNLSTSLEQPVGWSLSISPRLPSPLPLLPRGENRRARNRISTCFRF